MQLYTSTIKAMEDHEPLQVRPHLLTHLLGAGYVSSREKFRNVWWEVDSRRTKLELMEIFQPTVPFDARLHGDGGDGWRSLLRG